MFALWDVCSTRHPDFCHDAISLTGWWLFGGVGWVALAILQPMARLFNQRRCLLSSHPLHCLQRRGANFFARAEGQSSACSFPMSGIATATLKPSGASVQPGMLILSVRCPILPAKARWRMFAPCKERNSRWVLCSEWLAHLFNQTCRFHSFATYLAFAGEMAIF
jgi:hypothetical protein